MAGEPELIKVRLTDRGEDSETPWAHDLGPAPGPPGSRKVRLANVPFMHAKPTWGDVIIVTPVDDDFPLWDRGGVPWEQIATRIAEDGGRWAMIVDYVPHRDSADAFRALAEACAEIEVVCEGAWGPREGTPGRAYLAVKHDVDDVAVMKRLRSAKLPCELIQIHPEPAAKPAVAPVATKPAVKPVVTKPAVAPVATKPAVAKPVATKAAAAKPAATKPVATKAAPAKAAATKAAATKAAATKAAATKAAAKSAALKTTSQPGSRAAAKPVSTTRHGSKPGSVTAASKPTVSRVATPTSKASTPAARGTKASNSRPDAKSTKASTSRPAAKGTKASTSRPAAKTATSKPARRR